MTETHGRFTSSSSSEKDHHIIHNSDLHELIKASLKKKDESINNFDRYIYQALLKQMEQDLKDGKDLVFDSQNDETITISPQALSPFAEKIHRR